MRKFFGMVFLVIAGVFLNAVCVFGSVASDHRTQVSMSIALAVPALVALPIGIACMGWRRWRRDLGAVLLWVAGFAGFSILSMGCLLMDENFRTMIADVPLDDLTFSPTGSVFVAIFAALGWLLYRHAGSSAV